jgi:hypothetical protein
VGDRNLKLTQTKEKCAQLFYHLQGRQGPRLFITSHTVLPSFPFPPVPSFLRQSPYVTQAGLQLDISSCLSFLNTGIMGTATFFPIMCFYGTHVSYYANNIKVT